jgi:hypothetical protein
LKSAISGYKFLKGPSLANLEEQLVKQRTVFVAEKKATLLGYVTLLPLAKEGKETVSA